jgi:hypothetical protein
MGILFPHVFGWDGWYSAELDDDARRTLAQAVVDGAVPVAFEGYNYTYSHAGANTSVDVSGVNDTARTAVRALLDRPGVWTSTELQRELTDEFEQVFGLGSATGREADAGMLWMDFQHMTDEAPSQIVGHTRQTVPKLHGSVICGNVLRENRHTEGGEAVMLEEPDGAASVIRRPERVSITWV